MNIYVYSKKKETIVVTCSDLYAAQDYVKTHYKDECIILKDVEMQKFISSIITVDGKYVYNNKTYWTSLFAKDILEDYDNHTILDIFGKNVSKERYNVELWHNISKIAEIDGRAGQIEYNMQIGNEFISLFREECILTDFTKDSDTSPMIIFSKLDTVINMLQIGAFREAKQFLVAYREKIKDDFLTDERIDKYIAMLDAADAIQYATEEDYFYTAPDSNNEGE